MEVNAIAEGRRVALYLPTTAPLIRGLYGLHQDGRRNAYNVQPPGTTSLDQWAQTFRRGFAADAAALCSTPYWYVGPEREKVRVERDELLGYVWTYDYAPEHGTMQLGCLFRDNLRGIAHLEGLALWLDLLFDEYPLDVLGLECSERAAAQFGAFLPRLFTLDGVRRRWLRHGAGREHLSLWSMTRETWEASRFARGRYYRKGEL